MSGTVNYDTKLIIKNKNGYYIYNPERNSYRMLIWRKDYDYRYDIQILDTETLLCYCDELNIIYVIDIDSGKIIDEIKDEKFSCIEFNKNNKGITYILLTEVNIESDKERNCKIYKYENRKLIDINFGLRFDYMGGSNIFCVGDKFIILYDTSYCYIYNLNLHNYLIAKIPIKLIITIKELSNNKIIFLESTGKRYLSILRFYNLDALSFERSWEINFFTINFRMVKQKEKGKEKEDEYYIFCIVDGYSKIIYFDTLLNKQFVVLSNGYDTDRKEINNSMINLNWNSPYEIENIYVYDDKVLIILAGEIYNHVINFIKDKEVIKKTKYTSAFKISENETLFVRKKHLFHIKKKENREKTKHNSNFVEVMSYINNKEITDMITMLNINYIPIDIAKIIAKFI